MKIRKMMIDLTLLNFFENKLYTSYENLTVFVVGVVQYGELGLCAVTQKVMGSNPVASSSVVSLSGS